MFQQPFPTELLLNIFTNLNGTTLAHCTLVCRQWRAVIQHYDDLIWRIISLRDYEDNILSLFWSLRFPDPHVANSIGVPSKHSPPNRTLKRSWQDMYRITKNWHTGHCQAYFPEIKAPLAGQWISGVVGYPREASCFSMINISSTGSLVRSNPVYRNPIGPPHSLIMTDPHTCQTTFLKSVDDASTPGLITEGRRHIILCHSTLPSSKWIVTGGLDGSVALWDSGTRMLAWMWHGHRGRVLCVSMNDKLAVSGGTDSNICVWDLENHRFEGSDTSTRYTGTTPRGHIDISSYVSSHGDWCQGVGDIAVNTHLVACAPESAGPILVFSLLTGCLVYELQPNIEPQEWPFSGVLGVINICLTPFFLITKGKVFEDDNSVPVYPRRPRVPVTPPAQPAIEPPSVQMTPYQLYRYYQSQQQQQQQHTGDSYMETRERFDCLNVWSLQTGKMVYRLMPVLEHDTRYTITDIRLCPDFSRVLVCLETRGCPSDRHRIEERLYCWDFSCHSNSMDQPDTTTRQELTAVQIDGPQLSQAHQKIGKAWMYYM
ncbi:WD40-repeat-containing domain protein [Phycomyces nitens]|nr:WD40-repeat-containing domain protein [Phycomyces nitens]